MPDTDLDQLAARFQAQAISAPEFTHAAHLAVGLWHVRRYGTAEALQRMRSGIRQLNEAHGTPNTPERGYHETITRAYVVLLDAFLREPHPGPLADRLASLLSSPLGDRDVLLRHYSRERLFSPLARREWIDPDLQPLPEPAPSAG